MEQSRASGAVLTVAVNTTAAAHRRDHEHGAGTDGCHPHVVEVIHLGDRATAVCHDCRADTGFLPHKQAQDAADEHRRRTQVATVPLSAETD